MPIAPSAVAAGDASVSGAPACSSPSAAFHVASSSASHAPLSLNESTDHMASSWLAPRKADDAVFEPTWVAWNAVPTSRRPSTRSSQPVRSGDPGAARSISSIAEKCERLGSAIPTAWIMPRSPESKNGFSERHRGMKAEDPAERQELPLGDLDVRPPGLVVGVAGGHDGLQAVEPTAERQHHQHVAVVRRVRERHAREHPLGRQAGDDAGDPGGLQERAAGELRPGRAAAVPRCGRRLGGLERVHAITGSRGRASRG